MEIVNREHNHKILTQRRKKGALKAIYDSRKKMREGVTPTKTVYKQKNNSDDVESDSANSLM